jgi:excisionase family DNA binding protein
MDQDRMLTVAEIVDMLKVHEQTVRRWIKTGELRAIILGRRSGYRVPESALRDFLAKRNAGPDTEKAGM